MKFLQLFTVSQSFLVVSARLNESPTDNNRIIGGKEAREGRFPYTVSLADDFGHFCGGTLIAPDVVLTAAHCQGGEYNVIVGRHDLTDEQSGEVIPMNYEMPHPNYEDNTTDSDINLVFLSRPVSRDYLSLVTLNTRDDVPEAGDSVFVMGWGDTDMRDDVQSISDVLMGVEVKMISNDDCARSKGSIMGYTDTYEGKITPNMICAEDSGEDSCQGDSGGPLVKQVRTDNNGSSGDVQVGVVSWGIGCAHHSFPGVYAKVSAFYDWIQKNVCEKSSDPPSSFDCGSSLAMAYGNEVDTKSSNADQFVSNFHHKSAYRTSQDLLWSMLVEDDFTSGYTFFHNGGIGTTLYMTAMERSGVVRLSDGASLTSKSLTVSSYASFQVLLSFQFIEMAKGFGLCLDYSEDEGASWREFACHHSSSSFENGVWYEDISSELKPSDNIESLAIRVRSSEQGEALIDKVAIKGMA